MVWLPAATRLQLDQSATWLRYSNHQGPLVIFSLIHAFLPSATVGPTS